MSTIRTSWLLLLHRGVCVGARPTTLLLTFTLVVVAATIGVPSLRVAPDLGRLFTTFLGLPPTVVLWPSFRWSRLLGFSIFGLVGVGFAGGRRWAVTSVPPSAYVARRVRVASFTRSRCSFGGRHVFLLRFGFEIAASPFPPPVVLFTTAFCSRSPYKS